MSTNQKDETSFEPVGEADMCVVSVAGSGRPVFSKPHHGGQVPTQFWVRIGSVTKQLHGDDVIEFQSGHWG